MAMIKNQFGARVLRRAKEGYELQEVSVLWPVSMLATESNVPCVNTFMRHAVTHVQSC